MFLILVVNAYRGGEGASPPVLSMRRREILYDIESGHDGCSAVSFRSMALDEQPCVRAIQALGLLINDEYIHDLRKAKNYFIAMLRNKIINRKCLSISLLAFFFRLVVLR